MYVCMYVCMYVVCIYVLELGWVATANANEDTVHTMQTHAWHRGHQERCFFTPGTGIVDSSDVVHPSGSTSIHSQPASFRMPPRISNRRKCVACLRACVRACACVCATRVWMGGWVRACGRLDGRTDGRTDGRRAGVIRPSLSMPARPGRVVRFFSCCVFDNVLLLLLCLLFCLFRLLSHSFECLVAFFVLDY